MSQRGNINQREEHLPRSRSSGRQQSWVSKTDLISYLRCPYAFWLIDTGQVRFRDVIDEHLLQMLEEGTAFHEEVIRDARPIEVEADLPVLFKEESLTLLQLPTLENPDLRIHGQPDGIEAAGGALLPIEIKSHKAVHRTDKLELAFYWLLLEPYRTRRATRRKGIVILCQDGEAVQHEIELRDELFQEVRELVEGVRVARCHGVRPRVCRCGVCSSATLRGEILRQTLDARDLTLIFNIGRGFCRHLEELGYQSYEDLLHANPQDLTRTLRSRNLVISQRNVEGWVYHARSYVAGKPVVFGDGPVDLDEFVALDLEYDRHIWLIGACLVRKKERDYLALWADSREDQRKNLQKLVELVAKTRPIPIVTWAGDSADIPKLRSALAGMKLPQEVLASLFERHLDLYQQSLNSVRLPIPRLRLKDVSSYLGLERSSRITGGLEAVEKFRQYRRARDKKKKSALKDELVAYNRDDLDNLIDTLFRLAELGKP